MDQILESDMDQESAGNFHAEPYIVRRGSTSVAQPNMCTVVAATGNMAPLDPHYISELYNNVVTNRVTRFNGTHHQQNLDLNFYQPGMLALIGVLPVPLNHGARDQSPPSSSYSVAGVSDNSGRDDPLVEDVRGPCKRKNEGFQYCNASASSSSAVGPQHVRHSDEGGRRDASSFSVPQFRGSNAAPLMEIGPQTNLWTRSTDSLMVPHNNHLIHGSYAGQCFQPAAGLWIDQQLSANNIDGHNAAWNQSLSVPYVPGINVSRSALESGNMGLARYDGTNNNRSGPRFLPHRSVNQHLHHHGYPSSLHMQVGRAQNVIFHPHLIATSTSYWNPSYSTQSTVLPAQISFELGARHLRPVPQGGTGAYHPRRSGVTIEANLGHHNAGRLRVLPSEDLAPVELQEYYEAGDLIDDHGDMRLDIDHMSYEELLALGDWIGDVNTGLSEETIVSRLKTKTHVSAAINLQKEVASKEQETESCIICQEEYKNREKIGVLECGHEYHIDCLKKWLLVKNVCPICKKKSIDNWQEGST